MAKQIFQGNLLLIVCCACYLTWWILAFRPVGAIKGMKTGWILLPAAVAGVAAFVLILRGIGTAAMEKELFPENTVLWGGILVYLILLLVTVLKYKRPLTTELFLIAGWAMLALSEVNALYGMGVFSLAASLMITIVIGAATAGSLACYMLYYSLDGYAGYFDGMIPLLLAALTMVITSICMVV